MHTENINLININSTHSNTPVLASPKPALKEQPLHSIGNKDTEPLIKTNLNQAEPSDLENGLSLFNIDKLSVQSFINKNVYVRQQNINKNDKQLLGNLSELRSSLNLFVNSLKPNSFVEQIYMDLKIKLSSLVFSSIFYNIPFYWFNIRLRIMLLTAQNIFPQNERIPRDISNFINRLTNPTALNPHKNPAVYIDEVETTFLRKPHINLIMQKFLEKNKKPAELFRQSLLKAIHTNESLMELKQDFDALLPALGKNQNGLTALQMMIKLAVLSLTGSSIKRTELLKTLNTLDQQTAKQLLTPNQVYHEIWQIVMAPNFLTAQSSIKEEARTYFLSLKGAEISIAPKEIKPPMKSNEVNPADIQRYVPYQAGLISPAQQIISTGNGSTIATARISLLDPFAGAKKDAFARTCVTAIDWNASLLALGYEDGLVKLWQSEGDKYKLLSQFNGHSERINAIKIYKDFLINASDDMTISVWDTISNSYLSTLRGHKAGVTSLYVGWHDIGTGSTEILVSGSEDGSVKIWSFKTGNCLKTLEGHASGITSLQLLGDILITGSRDQSIKIWDLYQGICLLTLKGHTGDITSLIANDRQIISASNDRSIRIWDLDKGASINTLQGHHQGVTCLAMNHTYVVSGSDDKTIRVWNKTMTRTLRLLKGHTDKITCLCLNDNLLLSGSADHTLILWDISTGACLSQLNGTSMAKDLQHLTEKPAE